MNFFYITGMSKGIGKALAEELLKEQGNTVIGISRTRSISAKNYIHHALDLSSMEEVAGFEFGEHDGAVKIVLVNNAATLGEVRYAGRLQNDKITKSLNVNIIAPALLMNGFIKKYGKHRAERLIINLTSGAAQSPYDGWSLYCAGKAGLEMFSKTVAREQQLNDNGIRVLAIAPGVVDTDMQLSIRNADEKNFSRKRKFIELHENKQLYSRQAVAKEFASIIARPETIRDVVHRITLG